MKYVINPNLPENTELIIIGEKYADLFRESLSEYSISIVELPDNIHVDQRLTGHADLSVLHAGGDRILLAPYLKHNKFSEKLESLGFDVAYADIEQDRDYPNDSQLNICIAGEKLIYNKRIENTSIVKYLTNGNDYTLIDSRQGYSKCNVCIVNENSIITSDEGIYKSVLSYGMDVLLIHPGFIDLSGFDYGFIGGAAFKISNDTLAFTGYLYKHPDKDLILDFLSFHNIKPVYLTDFPIFDIGSAIPIIEK